MTPDELDRWSAEKVMGWYPKLSETDNEIYWCDPNDYKTTPGWKFKTVNWHPSNPTTGQIWMVVQRMRELGWYLYIEPEPNYTFPKMPGYENHGIIYEIGFYHPENQKMQQKPYRGFVMAECINCNSIIQAAWQALEGSCGTQSA